jgi:hypothetical protein
MNERDIRAVENMAPRRGGIQLLRSRITRTGMSFDELRKAFKEFSIEEIEKIYMRIRRERNDSAKSTPSKINCS